MSKTTKRKHVTKEVLETYLVPEEPASIVKVIASRGNNLHEVESPDGEKYLVSMPTKFRRNIWIKRGNFVVVEPIAEGDKVKAEIVQILLKDQIKYIKEEGKWPTRFEDKQDKVSSEENEIFANPNRRNDECDSSSDSDSNEDTEDSSEDDEDEEDEESSES